MKKLMMFLILMIFTSIKMYAIDPPCTTPCPGSNWIEVTITNLGLPICCGPNHDESACPGCTISFTYKYRECFGQIQLALIQVTKNGPCDQCEGWLVWYAADWIAKNNPLTQNLINQNWIPGTRYCITDMKFSMVTCYQWVAGGGMTNPDWHTEACTDPGCCVYKIEICKNEDGIVESAQQMESMPIICANSCFNSCGFFANKLIELDNNEFEITSLYPNPNKGKLNYKINNSEKGKYQIILNDLNGKEVLNEVINVNSIPFEGFIEMNDVSNGVYLYKIIINNNSVINGRIIVNK